MDAGRLTDGLIAARSFRELLAFASSDDLPRLLSVVEPYIRLQQRVNDAVLSRMLAGPLLSAPVSQGFLSAIEFVEHRHGEQAAALYRRLAVGAAEKTLLLRAGGGQTEMHYPASYFVASVIVSSAQRAQFLLSYDAYFARGARDALAQDTVQGIALVARKASQRAPAESARLVARAVDVAAQLDRQVTAEYDGRFRDDVTKAHGRARRMVIHADADVVGVAQLEEDPLVAGLKEMDALTMPSWRLLARPAFVGYPEPRESDASWVPPSGHCMLSEGEVNDFWTSLEDSGPLAAPPRPAAAPGAVFRLALPRKQQPPLGDPAVAAPGAASESARNAPEKWASTAAAARRAWLVDSDDSDDATKRAAAKESIPVAADGGASTAGRVGTAAGDEVQHKGKFVFDASGQLEFKPSRGRPKRKPAPPPPPGAQPTTHAEAAPSGGGVGDDAVVIAAVATTLPAHHHRHSPAEKVHRAEQPIPSANASPPIATPSPTPFPTAVNELDNDLANLPHFVQMAAFVGLRVLGLR